MSERAGQILRIACLLLAAWVVYELAGMVPRVNPLSHVVIPALPTLAADTNNAPPIAGAKTNVATSAAKGANKPGELASTNAPAHKSTNAAGSNVVTSVQVATAKTNPAPVEMTATNSTNAAIAAEAAPVDVTARTNSSMVATNISTNVPNVISAALVTPVEENPGTILVTRTNLTSTNVTMPQAATGSNASNSQAVLVSGTNRPAAAQARGRGTNGPAGMARAAVAVAGVTALFAAVVVELSALLAALPST